MKKTAALLAALLLALPCFSLAEAIMDLSGLDAGQLEAQRREADARLRLLALPDAQGYEDALDGEGPARAPQDYLGRRLRLSGNILTVSGEAPEFEYALSPAGKPERVFLVRYRLQPDERLLLPGDAVTVYGVFEGLTPFTGSQDLSDGAPILQADLVIHRLPEEDPLRSGAHPATRENPAPLAAAAVYTGSRWSGYAAFEVTVLSMSRGSQALKVARDMSKYNITPLKAQEYFIISVRVKALRAPEGRAPLGPEDFVFVSAGGKEYRQHFLLNPPTYLSTLYEGAEVTASLACLIDKGDTPRVAFLPQSGNALWFDPNQ